MTQSRSYQETEARAAQARAATAEGWTVDTMDADLADESDQTLEYYTRLAALRNAPWEQLTEPERRAQRARNMLAKRAFQAKRAADKAADVAKHQAEDARALAAYKAQARTTFPGTDKDFQRLWPHLRDQWLLTQTQQGLTSWEQAKIEKRKHLGDVI